MVTSVLSQEREALIQRLQAVLAEGRQIYWVCTLVEESETLESMAAKAAAQNLQSQLAPARVGLVHGRLKPSRKRSRYGGF